MQRISITNPQNIIDGTAKKYYFKLRNTGGPKGDKGEKGDTGQTGPQGPKGDAATVAVGSTTTLPVGYDATVENIGSLNNAVLNFGIPQGPQGPQGAKGDKGDTGAQGETGPRGPQGERGTNATVYIGTTSTLNPGSQATVYNSGTDSNAVINFGIPKGEKGDTGPMPTIAQTTGQAIDQVMSQKATTDALNAKQATIDSSHKLSADSVDDTSTTNKFVTAQDKTAWNAKQDALTAGNNIDIEDGVISTPAIAPEVVAELPPTGEEGKLYLTPKAHTTQTATGNPITATITEEAGKMESFKLDGDTYQRSYTGKNLCGGTLAQIKNMNSGGTWNGNSYTQAGITWTVYDNADGTIDRIEASGQATENGKTFYIDIFNRQQFEEQLGPEETYTLSGCPQGGSSGYYVRVASAPWKVMLTDRGSTATGTLIPSDNYSSVFVVLCVDTGAGQVNNLVFRPQLELGSTATSYEPYVGGVPSPNPDYPQAIQTVTGEQTVTVVGKNILDYVTGLIASGGGITNTINSDGTITTVGKLNADYRNIIGYYDLTPYLEDGATYTLSSTLYDSKTAAQVRRTKISDSSAHNYDTLAGAKTFTVDKSQYIYRMGIITNTMAQWGDESLTITKGYQLEKSSTGTAFAPYSKHTYEINLGSVELCKLGDYQDYIYKDGEDWKVHKATATLTLNGRSSENWYIDQYAYMLNGVISAKSFSDIANMEAYCKSFSKSATGQVSSYVVSFWYNAPGTGVRFIKDQTPDISSFRNWLASNNQTVYYPLATATDTTITDTTLIAQLESIRTASLQNGTNTITNTATGSNLAGDMEIGYYGYNPRNRYDKWLWLDINNEYEQIGS